MLQQQIADRIKVGGHLEYNPTAHMLKIHHHKTPFVLLLLGINTCVQTKLRINKVSNKIMKDQCKNQPTF